MTAAGEHDYVVVGAGSAGCVVARRLVDAGAAVAVVEAGGPATSPAIADPGRWPELMRGECDWAYLTEPQPGCANRRLHWPRGRVVGGTSALNGMAYIRGHPLDYDGWAYEGCRGWSFADVLPLFKRCEDCDRGPSEYRGTGGPLRVTTRYEPHPLLAAFVEAAQEAGVPFNDDHNAGELDGVGYSQLTIRDGVRQTAGVAFLDPVATSPLLTLVPNALALRLVFAGARCRGVEVARDGRVETIAARAEVVLAAGAIGSPQLLLLSGVGPAAELEQLGVERRVDLPGVGRNLHDHLLAPVLLAAPGPVPERRPGLTQHHAHLFWRSRPGLVVPDTQPLCFHMPLASEGWLTPPEHGYTIMGGLIRPASRGTLLLRSPDPTVPARLDPGCLRAGADLDALAASVELAREIARQPALRELTAGEVHPGPGVRTREQLRDYVRATATSYHHQVGTCRMGVDGGAVVDPELRVYGVEGLRVADASIMPSVTTGNTYAPALMIGERAADLLLAAR